MNAYMHCEMVSDALMVKKSDWFGMMREKKAFPHIQEVIGKPFTVWPQSLSRLWASVGPDTEPMKLVSEETVSPRFSFFAFLLQKAQWQPLRQSRASLTLYFPGWIMNFMVTWLFHCTQNNPVVSSLQQRSRWTFSMFFVRHVTNQQL